MYLVDYHHRLRSGQGGRLMACNCICGELLQCCKYKNWVTPPGDPRCVTSLHARAMARATLARYFSPWESVPCVTSERAVCHLRIIHVQGMWGPCSLRAACFQTLFIPGPTKLHNKLHHAGFPCVSGKYKLVHHRGNRPRLRCTRRHAKHTYFLTTLDIRCDNAAAKRCSQTLQRSHRRVPLATTPRTLPTPINLRVSGEPSPAASSTGISMAKHRESFEHAW